MDDKTTKKYTPKGKLSSGNSYGTVEDVPVEAPQVDKPLDTKALEKALSELHEHTKQRPGYRHGLEQVFSPELTEYLLKGEEAYLQSLKNKIAALIQGATRIA